MVTEFKRYNLFFDFIKTFAPNGFKGIDPKSPLMLELEEMMENNIQFFLVADMIQMKILFTSKRSIKMIGIEPKDVNPYHFKEAAHPDDIKRHGLGNAKLFNLSHELFVAESGEALVSTNLRIRNPIAGFSQILFQCYLFYTPVPYKTVYLLQIHTDIDWSKRIKQDYHYYIGKDLSYFKFPDEKMLMKGNIFTNREFEIIKLIHSGLNSEQIADKLFLSKHTVNTHRNNILEKTGKKQISDLIYDLQEQGLI